MADRAHITPKVLKWARESARMSEDNAASKIAVSAQSIKEWEKGISYPTIRQAKILAKIYRRPFAILFLPDIPSDFQPLQDFRKKGSRELSTSSVFIIREIQQKQAWISDVIKENGENKVPVIGRFSINDNPELVAKDILRTLNIDPLSYKTNNPILEWIDSAESEGIFISRTSFIHSRLKLDSDEIQGFAIADIYAPFIFINSDDWSAPLLFTMVHELAHLWIAETGISNEIEPLIKKSDKYHPVELFCNEVAANALIPRDYVYNLNPDVFDNSTEIYKKAKNIGISSYALLIRALNLKVITIEEYRKLKTQADKEYQNFLLREEERKKKAKEKEGEGGPNYFLLQLNRNSRLFTQTVLDAFYGGNIEATQASSLLNVKVNKFPKLEAQMYK